MGKGTDKLYITHSEWSSSDAFSASSGSGVAKSKGPDAPFRRLPFNFCAISLQPFSHPVCTPAGTTFDVTNIVPWIKKHGTNPVDGSPLKSSELVRLNFTKNEDGEYVDPVTYKPLTDNTHIVALKNTGNVFSWDTVERLNIKAKNWKDLVTDDEFSRKDIITLQDPEHLNARNLSTFKFLKDGNKPSSEPQDKGREDSAGSINLDALGSSAKILKAKEAVAKSRAERAAGEDPNKTDAPNGDKSVAKRQISQGNGKSGGSSTVNKPVPYNAAKYTTGQAAASFTSTGVTVHTSSERALLSEEDYMLKPKRVKQKGYARIKTNLGILNVELQTEYAPKAVWNFVRLAQQGYYRGISFHRNIRNFMIQGGDPTGTGRGGQSIWGKPFEDEFAQSPLAHNTRGVLSMANKGKNTNTSQFFITYRQAPHLNRKHTIFGKIVDDESDGESEKTLSKLENVKTEDDKPVEDCRIEDIVVFVDPFDEFMKDKKVQDSVEKQRAEDTEKGGTEDENTTWTGKRLRNDTTTTDSAANGVGKYLDMATKEDAPQEEVIVEEWELPYDEPPPKKRKAGGFGNFDNW